MVDHDKLMCTMYDLGFTEDTVDAVKIIYNAATTHVSLAGTACPAMQIGKGTIQGDTLPPLLGIMFVEPLLRWMHTEGRGYKQQCLATYAQCRQTGRMASQAGSYHKISTEAHEPDTNGPQ